MSVRQDPRKVCRVKVSEIERHMFRERASTAIYALGIIGCIGLLIVILLRWL